MLDVTQNEYVQGAIVVTAILGALYGVFWRQRRDWNHDGLEAQRDKLRSEYVDDLVRARVDRDRYQEACERIGHERNEAVQKVGALEKAVEMLTLQVETLEAELHSVREELKEAREEIKDSHVMLAAMSENMNILVARTRVTHPNLNIQELI